MGMVVRTNIMAVNANRQLGMNNSQVGKSLEKLASGFRINRAGDDASGLAISEKMKAQIKGLETASANSQDGISLIQTAEGALTEVHDMLNRMVELAGKSANGTMDDDVDRASLQKELESLQKEIDRISEGTNFNGKMLLNGSLDAGTSGVGSAGIPAVKGLYLQDNTATKFVTGDLDLTDILADDDFSAGNSVSATFEYTDANGKHQQVTIELSATNKGGADRDKEVLVAADGTEYSIASNDWTDVKAEDLADAFLAEAKKAMGNTFKISSLLGDGTDINFDGTAAGGNITIQSLIVRTNDGLGTATSVTETLIDTTTATQGIDAFQSFNFAGTDYEIGDVFTVGGKKFTFVADDADLAALDKDVNGVVLVGMTLASADVEAMQALIEQKTGYKAEIDGTVATQFNFKAPVGATAKASGGLVLQVGDTADAFNKVTVSIRNMSCAGIGISGISVADQDSASEALTALKNTDGTNEFGAINIVSSTRADLGALQNKLEHTINNLDVAAENMTAANSRIRDTDMAKEMMNYTKMNVLTQAAQAMLAQANSSTQSVLQLLQ